MRSKEDAWAYSSYEQKKAGLWIKENTERQPVVMSADFRAAFYAEGEHIPLSSNSLNEVLTEAAVRNVDFLVIDERNIKNQPQLTGLLREPRNYPELEIVYQASDRPGYKIVVYRLKSGNFPLSSKFSKADKGRGAELFVQTGASTWSQLRVSQIKKASVSG